jgi:hypothetical protein
MIPKIFSILMIYCLSDQKIDLIGLCDLYDPHDLSDPSDLTDHLSTGKQAPWKITAKKY